MRVFLAGAVAVIIALPAAAETRDELRQQCFATKVPVLRVAICSKLIDVVQDTPSELSAAYTVRGFGYSEMDRSDDALVDYGRAIEIDPTNDLALNNRGMVFLKRGDALRARADFERLVQLKPNDYRSYYRRCDANSVADRLEAALADCNTALKLRPDYFFILETRAVVYLKMKAYAAAIADYNAALKEDPDEELLLFGRGIARRRSGDKAGGDADVAKALKGDPEVEAIMAKRGIR